MGMMNQKMSNFKIVELNIVKLKIGERKNYLRSMLNIFNAKYKLNSGYNL